MLITVIINVSIHSVFNIAFEGKGKHCCQLVIMLWLSSDQHKECVVFLMTKSQNSDYRIATWRHADKKLLVWK